MNYDVFMQKVLNGKSVLARSKELGIPQKTLNNYVIGRSAPGCAMTKMLAKEAGVSIADAVDAVAEQEVKVRPVHAPSFLRPAAAAVLTGVMSVTMFLTPTPSQAASALTSQGQTNLHYVK